MYKSENVRGGQTWFTAERRPNILCKFYIKSKFNGLQNYKLLSPRNYLKFIMVNKKVLLDDSLLLASRNWNLSQGRGNKKKKCNSKHTQIVPPFRSLWYCMLVWECAGLNRWYTVGSLSEGRETPAIISRLGALCRGHGEDSPWSLPEERTSLYYNLYFVQSHIYLSF